MATAQHTPKHTILKARDANISIKTHTLPMHGGRREHVNENVSYAVLPDGSEQRVYDSAQDGLIEYLRLTCPDVEIQHHTIVSQENVEDVDMAFMEGLEELVEDLNDEVDDKHQNERGYLDSDVKSHISKFDTRAGEPYHVTVGTPAEMGEAVHQARARRVLSYLRSHEVKFTMDCELKLTDAACGTLLGGV